MWMKIFDNYMLAIQVEGDDLPDTRKLAIILHSLGTKGQCIFINLEMQVQPMIQQ